MHMKKNLDNIYQTFNKDYSKMDLLEISTFYY